MNKEKFWGLIETTLDRYDGSLDSYIDELGALLDAESIEDLLEWQRIFEAYLELTDIEKLWAVSYVINGSMTEDSFEAFKAWLISLGEEMFYAVIEEPDRLADLEVENPDEFLAEFEDLLFIGLDVYAAKQEQDPEEVEEQFYELVGEPSDALLKELAEEVDYPEDADLDWDFEDEGQLRALFPQTYEKFVE